MMMCETQSMMNSLYNHPHYQNYAHHQQQLTPPGILSPPYDNQSPPPPTYYCHPSPPHYQQKPIGLTPQPVMFDMNFTSFNHQDFPYLHNNNEAYTKKMMKKQRKERPKVPKEVIRQRQLRRNERERARQNRLNDAFDVLRNTIPDFLTPYKKGDKLTQIETLRLAKYYIRSLKQVLNKDEEISENHIEDEKLFDF